MLRHLFITAIRHFKKNSLLTTINIFGLSCGFFLLYLAYMNLSYSSSYDKFHKNSEAIYRVLSYDKAFSKFSALTNYQVGSIAKLNTNEVIYSTKVRKIKTNIELGNERFNENTLCVDQDFFQLFDIRLISGDKMISGMGYSSILIDEALSLKLFGTKDAVGKSVALLNGSVEKLYTIAGVFVAIPENSNFYGTSVISGFSIIDDKYISPEISSINYSIPDNMFQTFILVSDGFSLNSFVSEFNDLLHRFQDEGVDLNYELQPLTDIYLNSSHIANDQFEHGNNDIILYISFAAYLLIISVLINFILLSFAYYSKLMKGIGIRKVFGVSRTYIISYFLFESILISTIAGIIAITMIFSVSAILDFGFLDFINVKVIGYFLIMILLVGSIAGTYISINLSAIKPMSLLKNNLIYTSKSAVLRRALMALQIIILCGLMCFSLLINRQIDFSLNSDIGLEPNNLIVLKTQGKGEKNIEAFKDLLLTNSNIVSVTGGINMPPTESFAKTLIKSGDDSYNQFEVFWCDYDIVETMGFQLLSGTSFRELKGSGNYDYVIINESAKDILNLDDVEGGFIEYEGRKHKIQGIIRDFHMRSFDHPIEPMIIFLNPQIIDDLVIRARDGSYQNVSTFINQNIKRFIDVEYDINSYDAILESMYHRLFYFYRIAKVFLFFTTVITAMGMFALSQYDISLKQKEIAIRKLFGSTKTETVAFLSTPFLKIIALSFIIGIPAIIYLMDIWRSNFIYAYNNYFLIFSISIVAVSSVLLFSILYNLIENSRVNIVEMLKSE